MEGATYPTTLVPVSTGVSLNVADNGTGEPLLLVIGTGGSLGFWDPLLPAFTENHRAISYDARGLGESERGDGPITMASLAADAVALLDALEIERAHFVGWSLGSAVGQELAIAHPDRVGALILYGTWAKTDNFQRAMITALCHPWSTGDVEAAYTSLGLAFSPEFVNSPEFEPTISQFLHLFPQTDLQIRTVVEQWQADLEHDTLDRLGQITAPTLVIGGEQDILTPPWQCQAVAEAIPGAHYERLTGPGSSHGLFMERGEEFVGHVLGFIAEHPLD